jgi:hypothetical protein
MEAISVTARINVMMEARLKGGNKEGAFGSGPFNTQMEG